MSESKEVLSNVLGSRARSRQNSTATVITGDIVTEDKQQEAEEKEHHGEAQD